MRLILLTLFILSFGVVFAQNDSLDFYMGLPVIHDDTVSQTSVPDMVPMDQYIRLSPDSLPKRVVETLAHDDIFKGWQKASLYYDKNTKLYVIHLASGNSIRTYRFNADGEPVAYSETSKPRDH